ncbi:nuclear transport factor 2 family protein [Fibrella arboris]|uniref:nuclear transport factor 2 family protein n=1 Tax=Fibrella arboris TaxID=3242486 RepID=UPI003523034F
MQAHEQLLKEAYLNFNQRHIDGALALMQPDVEWPNGMEGGYVYGHQGIRAYWTRQWTLINPHVEPLSFTVDDDGRVRTEVHQFIKDLSGTILIDETVYHVYTIENGLIRRMAIERIGE